MVVVPVIIAICFPLPYTPDQGETSRCSWLIMLSEEFSCVLVNSSQYSFSKILASTVSPHRRRSSNGPWSNVNAEAIDYIVRHCDEYFHGEDGSSFVGGTEGVVAALLLFSNRVGSARTAALPPLMATAERVTIAAWLSVLEARLKSSTRVCETCRARAKADSTHKSNKGVSVAEDHLKLLLRLKTLLLYLIVLAAETQQHDESVMHVELDEMTPARWVATDLDTAEKDLQQFTSLRPETLEYIQRIADSRTEIEENQHDEATPAVATTTAEPNRQPLYSLGAFSSREVSVVNGRDSQFKSTSSNAPPIRRPRLPCAPVAEDVRWLTGDTLPVIFDDVDNEVSSLLTQAAHQRLGPEAQTKLQSVLQASPARLLKCRGAVRDKFPQVVEKNKNIAVTVLVALYSLNPSEVEPYFDSLCSMDVGEPSCHVLQLLVLEHDFPVSYASRFVSSAISHIQSMRQKEGPNNVLSEDAAKSQPPPSPLASKTCSCRSSPVVSCWELRGEEVGLNQRVSR